jgi:hypothetical protein
MTSATSRVVHNPYSKPYSKEAKAVREKDKAAKRTVETMMRNMNKPSEKEKKNEMPMTMTMTARTVVAQAAAAQRKKNKEEKNKNSDIGKKGNWQKRTWNFFAAVVSELKKNVGFEERGQHKRYGAWPKFARGSCIDPSKDPHNHLDLLGEGVGEDGIIIAEKEIQELTREDFALPSILVWAPELRWPHLYPEGRPFCAWHRGCTGCVAHLGYSTYTRRCYGPRGNEGLLGRRYKCTARESAGEMQYCFYNYDAEVLAQAPQYVQGYWRENGYCISEKQGSIKWMMIDEMRALLAHGSGASGYSKTVNECYKQSHSNKARMWRDHCDVMHQCGEAGKRVEKRSVYFDADDPRAEMNIPSVNFLLSTTIKEIESKIPYYERKLEMVGGRFLPGDHSHKYAKVVLIDGERGFEGIYTLMNEFGKILGFWFVSGTTMKELEESLRGINRRYELHGFDGPLIFTTDRCCDDRDFISGKRNKGERPIFVSFENQSGEPENNADNSAAGSFMQILQADLPCPPVLVTSKDIGIAACGDIISECDEKGWDVIAIDTEWVIGTKQGPHVIQIGLPDGNTYIFPKDTFNQPLFALLENATIKKVANRINSDRDKLAEIGITLKGTIELGHRAKERGIVDRLNPSLKDLVRILFNCELDKNAEIRISDWSRRDLSLMQLWYAAIDVYCHMRCYQKLMAMPHVDPIEAPIPKLEELNDGDSVLLFTTNKSQVIAEASIVGRIVKTVPYFGSISVKDKITVRVARDGARKMSAKVEKDGEKSLAMLFRDEGADTGLVEFPWRLSRIRRIPNQEMRPSQVESVEFSTKLVSVPVLPVVIEEENDNTSTGDSNDKDHERTSHKGVKQDIAHIFLRFSKVISKSHGGFGTFMARLSDAFFVPSQDDIDFIKNVLRKFGLSEDEIKKKKWQYFKKRVRRRVPGRKELEIEFLKVVNLLADIKDSKTGKPLFNEKAWNLYKSTLKHIQTGCLSDVPGLAYYVQIGEDSMGIPLFTCLRGTSALEGFHQKIRQLIRGFNVSPRYAIALLYEFIHRWNHDIDIRILGLPTNYANFYDGWVVEDEIEQVCSWEELQDPLHPFWVSTNDFMPTGESFAFIRHASASQVVAGNESGAADKDSDEVLDSDELLELEIAKVVDAVRDGRLEANGTEDSVEKLVLSSQVLTESASWVAKQLGQKRGVGKVRSKIEKEFFRKHHLQFQSNADDNEVDNFSSFAFGRMVAFWNEWITDEERGVRPRSDMMLKSAYHLQAHYKQFKKEANCAATLLPVRDANKVLRQQYRGPSRNSSATIPAPEKRVAKSSPDEQNNNIPSSEGNRVIIPPFLGRERLQARASSKRKPNDGNLANPAKKKKIRAGARCRQCGHEVRDGSDFYELHPERGTPGSQYKQPGDVCRVPVDKDCQDFQL